MTRLLILTDWFAPGYLAGGPIRSVINLVHALEEDFEIFVATGDRDYQSENQYPSIKVNQWTDFSLLTKIKYLSPDHQRMFTIKSIIDEVNPNFIYLNSMFSLPFTILPLVLYRMGKIKNQLIIAPRGMLHSGALRYKPLKKKIFLWLFRNIGIVKNLRFQATDDQELHDVIKYTNAHISNVHNIGNLPQRPPFETNLPDKDEFSAKFIFLSRISPKKNLLFFLERLSEVSEKLSIQLSIAGPIEDKKYWEKCQKRIHSLPSNIYIKFVDAIPHHLVGKALQSHHFFVLPTFGENFGHVIFEALANGLPVIISDQTPWRKLKLFGVGYDIPLENPEQFIEAITHFASMPAEDYQQYSTNAKQYAKNFFDQSNLINQYREMFNLENLSII